MPNGELEVDVTTERKTEKVRGLRERCRAFYQQQGMNAMLRQGDPVEDIMAFVIAETGRTAEPSLAETVPLCLYFPTTEDRDDFISLVREAKPGMMMKKLP